MNKNNVILSLILIVVAGIVFTGRTAVMAENDLDDTVTVKIDEQGYIQVDEGRLYYEIAGQGKTIVMIHDGMLHRETWDYQFAEFSRDYRVVRYDRRGYGKSDRPTKPYSNLADLKKLFADLNIEKAILMGCSAGGGLSIDFAIASPEKVEALILDGSVVNGFPLTDHVYNRGGRLTPELYNDQEAFFKYWRDEDPYTINRDNVKAGEMIARLLDANPQNMALEDYGKRKPDAPALAHLSEIAVPVLSIVGEFDMPDVHAHSGAIDAGIPDSRRVILPGAAHLTHLDKPEEFNKLVRDFFVEIEFLTLAEAEGYEKAVELLDKKGVLATEKFPFTERELTMMGYARLQSGQVRQAVNLFRLCVQMFPDAWNAYDSYGEALLAAGDTAAAIQNYQKSLELNPDNTGARRVLEGLKE